MAGLQDVDVSKLSPADQMEVQLQLERDSIDAALMKWRHEHDKMRKMGINTELGITSSEEGSLSQHTASWLHALEKRLQEEFRLIEMSESKEKKSEVDLERCVYGPLIQQSDPARLAAITILSTLNLGAMYGVDKGIMVAKLVNQIAKHAQEDIQAQQRERREKARRRERKVQMKAGKEVQANAASEETTVLLDGQREQELLNESSRQPWSVAIKAQVGAILLKALMETAKMKVTINHPQTGEPVSQFQPTFTHIQQVRKGKKTGVLLINPKLVERLMKEPMGDYLAKHLPMIVEPKPWRKFNEGGFLEGRTSLVRVKPGDVEQRLYTNAALKSGDMGQLLKGLDVLGKTAWRINTDVLNVMMDAWNSGEETANMPALSPEFTMPQEPDPIENPGEHRFWKRAVKAIENERSGLHSQRCFMNLQLEIARAFRNQTIYFPHNVDYRGRAYPIPTYLNHMGADHTRGLLTFSKGKELGARGLRWLKIHLANVYGLDKASFDDREAFANEHVADIIDSATNPLNGQRWWLKAEEPWQCLATCFELRGALALDDPTKFVSHMPVQQDGTCNGLQHYAALGGDTWGAKQVNLEPGEKPADVYSAVAELVKAGIAKDAESKIPAALALDGKITRKVVKQTVMTNVYGVTFAGAKKQVCKQLDALYPDLGKEHDTNNIMLASYVAKHIFTALATMFRGAHDIQYWLGEVGGRVCRALTVAQLNQIAEGFEGKMPKASKKGKSSSWTQAGVEEITKSFRSSVVWTTPLRMPVVQPYRKSTNKEIRTCFQSLVYPVSDQTDPVNRKKQLQGFPPNFIHSLDASHMLLSALQCHDLGLNFAAVHDSFWTHAADIDSMNSVLREAFIQIHEEDVIGRLATEFKARHNGSLYLAHIDSNTPVGKKIMELRKNSKLSPKEELLLEHKRNTLRLSGNPWDLEAAKQIVTPASVYEDMAANEEDLEIKEDVKEISLGLVPDQETTPSEHEQMVDNVDSLVAAEDVVDDIHEAASEDADTETTPVKAAPKKKSTLSLWLPLTIPTIPKKVIIFFQILDIHNHN
jgi:DNA-directed RNA polymerase